MRAFLDNIAQEDRISNWIWVGDSKRPMNVCTNNNKRPTAARKEVLLIAGVIEEKLQRV